MERGREEQVASLDGPHLEGGQLTDDPNHPHELQKRSHFPNSECGRFNVVPPPHPPFSLTMRISFIVHAEPVPRTRDTSTIDQPDGPVRCASFLIYEAVMVGMPTRSWSCQ